ncbi:hypothetical protein Nepgr_029459 [Nepenthes gracilis]|uniref:non-specific serine/threonine protein kinase n=1 Tax=Nepenthes gracilis TaxID=150966 RepID=A0AAD3Y5K2_NEPGR|nr:hypothetical protein Nepgr_029459 [Nepenthes gracilis]
MEPPEYAPIALLFITSLLALPSPISSQVCQRYCSNIRLKYPFGAGAGCGHPRFQNSVTCSSQKQLIFTTHTGCYPITEIDYSNEIIYISDPTMSTCFCMQPSKGFGLDCDAPFSFHDSTIFALLGCSAASSPIYRTNGGANINGGNSTRYVPQCDNESTPFCSSLYSCQPISQLYTPISTCCVYTPVDLGPSFEMDLRELKCFSYTAVYSFSGREDDPGSWKYGVALQYKFNVGNDYPSFCAACESSNGVCGYSGEADSFICNCPSGENTTTDCYFQTSWNHGFGLLPWSKGTWLINIAVELLLVWFMH